MPEYTLESPFMSVSFTASLSRWQWAGILGAWLVFWAALSVGVIYAYAVVFAGWVGFETAVLVGIALVILGGGGADA